jgi:hypothetical protein
LISIFGPHPPAVNNKYYNGKSYDWFPFRLSLYIGTGTFLPNLHRRLHHALHDHVSDTTLSGRRTSKQRSTKWAYGGYERKRYFPQHAHIYRTIHTWYYCPITLINPAMTQSVSNITRANNGTERVILRRFINHLKYDESKLYHTRKLNLNR